MSVEEFDLADRDFERVKSIVRDAAGISLSDAKRTLVISRLSRVVREKEFSGFKPYLDFLQHAANPADLQTFVNALTTNLTRFFREDHHFDHLVEWIGMEIRGSSRASRKRLRIWSAGCSTGQEAYTIALALLDAFPDLARWDFRILATDIDTNVLKKAKEGIYSTTEIEALSPQRKALFEPAGEGLIRIPEKARALVSFRPLNLFAPWPMKGRFDAIFCRNVAIYFDKATQQELFARFSGQLAPDGHLYIGHSENLGAASGDYRAVGKTIYRKNPHSVSRTAA